MQFTQVLAILSLTAGSLAMPNANVVLEEHAQLSKRTCWELTGTALSICQKACSVACEAASFGIAGSACAAACSAPNLKRAEIEPTPAREGALAPCQVHELQTRQTEVSVGFQITDINAIEFDTDNMKAIQEAAVNTASKAVDVNINSAGRTACVVACEVTCNSTVLALIQTKCLAKCKGLCPAA